eukprot:Skav225153  [mRNA]  locus=scaffold1056:283860:284837:- [translate_table: standard]
MSEADFEDPALSSTETGEHKGVSGSAELVVSSGSLLGLRSGEDNRNSAGEIYEVNAIDAQVRGEVTCRAMTQKRPAQDVALPRSRISLHKAKAMCLYFYALTVELSPEFVGSASSARQSCRMLGNELQEFQCRPAADLHMDSISEFLPTSAHLQSASVGSTKVASPAAGGPERRS